MGLMSPAKRQCGVGLSCHAPHRHSPSQACCPGTVAARSLDIPQNSNGAVWEWDSSVSGKDTVVVYQVKTTLVRKPIQQTNMENLSFFFQNLTLFSAFQTVFIKAMPNSILL